MLVIERLLPPYPSVNVQVLAEQEQFIDPVAKALSTMKEGEIPFLVRSDHQDVGFFTLRPSADDQVEQLRSPNRCTLLSFMIDAKQQGKGFGSHILSKLAEVASTSFPGAHSIGLTVNCRNSHAYRLYEKNGFRDFGELYHGGSAGPQHIMILDLLGSITKA
jgi:ribosomal protein S18 acetylase RimI-like enzyme